jgi:hypothetical protein
VIDCLCFFFPFSLLSAKVNTYPLCLLFVKLDMFVMLKHLGSGMVGRPKTLGSSMVARPKHLRSGIVVHAPWVWHDCQPHVAWV